MDSSSSSDKKDGAAASEATKQDGQPKRDSEISDDIDIGLGGGADDEEEDGKGDEEEEGLRVPNAPPPSS